MGAKGNGVKDWLLSDNVILAAMRRMAIGKEEMSGNGFRAMARTILNEVLGACPDCHQPIPGRWSHHPSTSHV